MEGPLPQYGGGPCRRRQGAFPRPRARWARVRLGGVSPRLTIFMGGYLGVPPRNCQENDKQLYDRTIF